MLTLTGLKLNKYSIISDTLYFLPRNDNFKLFTESEKARLTYDYYSRDPSRADVELKVPGASELCTVANVYNLFFTQIDGISAFHKASPPVDIYAADGYSMYLRFFSSFFELKVLHYRKNVIK